MNRIALRCLPIAIVFAFAHESRAACGAPFLISSINNTSGYYAYVINPTVTPGEGGDGAANSTITDQLSGFFWGVGVGDPAPGVGADNGTFAALEWFYLYPNYPAAVLTSWAADTGIDTCINVMGPLGERCQATFFQDVDTESGPGLFALVTTPDDDSSGDFFLDNGGINIVLAPMSGPEITGLAFTGCVFVEFEQWLCTGANITVRGPSTADLMAGMYLSDDPACQGAGAAGEDPLNGLVLGWKLYQMVLPRGSRPPSDYGVGAGWVDTGLGTIALGIQAEPVEFVCDEERDVYLSWQLVLDGGFESPRLSQSSTRVECKSLYAEPDDVRVRPQGRQAPRTRRR